MENTKTKSNIDLSSADKTNSPTSENDNPFLEQVRDLLSRTETGEYEMQEASLIMPIADISKAPHTYRRCEQTGHIFVSMLLYKRPDKTFGD